MKAWETVANPNKRVNRPTVKATMTANENKFWSGWKFCSARIKRVDEARMTPHMMLRRLAVALSNTICIIIGLGR